MSFPFTSSELRDLIERLERLEDWQKKEESSSSSQGAGKGYRRGDPKARAVAAGTSISKTSFPGIPQIARLWTLEKEAGPEFVGSEFRTLDQGPGPVPAIVEEQAVFVAWDQTEALNRVHLAFSAGFWARLALETFTDQIAPAVISEKSSHFIVLRACGLGGVVRFDSEADFNHFRQQVFAGGCVFHGFETETELEVFCQGAHIAVPPLFRRTKC